MKSAKIENIRAQEILDSRGNPTVRVWVSLANGIVAGASVPSGASTGSHEALELRDGGKRFLGKGVQKACKNVEKIIAPALKGHDIFDQRGIDMMMCELDGTPSKKKLGANAILGVSLACARAAGEAAGEPLYAYIRKAFNLRYKGFLMPTPTMNVINGGMHADNNLVVQEYMIIPRHKRFCERVRMGAEVFAHLRKILKEKKLVTAVGDEGGFAPLMDGYAPRMNNNEEVFVLLCDAIRAAGYKPGKDISLGIDAAFSEFYKDGVYYVEKKDWSIHMSGVQVRSMLGGWAKKYPIMSIEDGLAEDDWEEWRTLTKEMGKKMILVGDDLFVTNKERLERGIKEKVANAILIKLNQIGTLTETVETVQLAQKNGYKVSVSHRSGETSDTFIADLAVAVNADFIKSGSLSRSERVEKYNRLMEIEAEIFKFF